MSSTGATLTPKELSWDCHSEHLAWPLSEAGASSQYHGLGIAEFLTHSSVSVPDDNVDNVHCLYDHIGTMSVLLPK